VRFPFRDIHSIEELQRVLGKNIHVEDVKNPNLRISIPGQTIPQKAKSTTIDLTKPAALKALKATEADENPFQKES